MRRSGGSGCSATSRSTWRPAAPTIAPIRSCSGSGLVAGAPPDAFSDDGQLWGNPVYDWPATAPAAVPLVGRAAAADACRCSIWPGSTTSAGSCRTGRCRRARARRSAGAGSEGPGGRCSTRVGGRSGRLRVVAEDLGVITPAVTALARVARVSGDGRAPVRLRSSGVVRSPHAFENHVEDRVVYTGTHDHDTARGGTRRFVCGSAFVCGCVVRPVRGGRAPSRGGA